MWIQLIRPTLISPSGFLALGLLGWSSVLAAGEAPTAAELDWQPWSELPAGLQDQVPAYCGGIYRPPALDAGTIETQDARQAGEGRLVNISSRHARYRLDESVELSGDVRLRQGRLRARGDNARYDQTTGEINLQGRVVSRGEAFLLTGEDAIAGNQGDELSVNTATFLLHGNHMRGEAARIRRTGDESMRIERGVLTTCQPHRNDWSLAATSVDLNRENGTGTARNVRLRVRDVPVFYIPWISFPIDDRRKSGFLYPSLGTSNTDTGIFLATPYYFNLAPNYDMTYTPQFIGGRGFFSELEARYLGPYGQSDLQLGYINDDDDFADEAPGNDATRWGVDFTNRSDFGNSWRGSMDLAAVSDSDYIEDLNRTLDLDQETRLLNQGELRYTGPLLDFSAGVRGFRTIDEAIADRDRPYNQLPRLRLDAGQTSGNWEWRSESEYNFFTRDNDQLDGLDAAVGHRLRTRPEVAWELSGLPGFVRSSLMLDHTQYVLDDIDNDGRSSRSVPFYDADAGLVFERFLTLGNSAYSQTLEPRLFYVFSPERDQSDIPNFDTTVTSFNFNQLFVRDRFTGGDRVGDNNRLTTAVTSRLFDQDAGLERARISIGRTERFDVQRVGLPNGEGRSLESSSPLAGELMVQPMAGLTMRTTGQWEVDEQETLRGTSQLRYQSPEARYIFNASHTYDADSDLEQADLSTVLPLGEQISLIGRWLFDMDNDETAGSLAGIEYTSCCWSAQFVSRRYRTQEGELDTGVMFQIQLRGLGGGGGATETIREEIPGFEQRRQRFAQPPVNELRRPGETRWP